jgi:hypothetical protein
MRGVGLKIGIRTGFAVRPSRTTVHTDPLSGRAEQPLGGQLI